MTRDAGISTVAGATALPGGFQLNAITPLAQRSMFWCPNYLVECAWVEHIPFAFWLVEAHRPRVLVELGTHSGVSYFAFCQAADRLGLDTRCFAVATWRCDKRSGLHDERAFEKVKTHNEARYSGFSRVVRSSFDDALKYFEDSTIDLLHIDGLHTLEAVRHDFAAWLPKLSRRAIVLLHDTDVREQDFGVARLFDTLKSRYPHFEFVNGHGLRVLGVGADQTDTIQWLLQAHTAEQTRQAIHEVFARLGRACADSLAVASHEERARALAEEIDRQKSEHQQQIEVAKKNIRERDRAIKELTQQLNARIAAQTEEQEKAQAQIRRLDASRQQMERAVHGLFADKQAQAKSLEDRYRELAVLTKILARLEAENAKLTNEHAAEQRRTAQLQHTLSWKLAAPVRALEQLFIRSPTEGTSLADEIDLIAESGLFDEAWYRARTPEVAGSSLSPIEHYLRHGAADGRNPGPEFDARRYLATYRDVAETGINPLVHYVRFGRQEGRTAHRIEEDNA